MRRAMMRVGLLVMIGLAACEGGGDAASGPVPDGGQPPQPGWISLSVTPPAAAVEAGVVLAWPVRVRGEGELPVTQGAAVLRARVAGSPEVLGEAELASLPGVGEELGLTLPLALWSDQAPGAVSVRVTLEPAGKIGAQPIELAPAAEVRLEVATPAASELRFTDGRLALTLAAATGTVLEVRAVRRELILSTGSTAPAWRLGALDPDGRETVLTAADARFAFRERPGVAAAGAPGPTWELRWHHPVSGYLVQGELGPGERPGEVLLQARAAGVTGWTPRFLEYPLLGGIGRLERAGGTILPPTYLALPVAGGLLLEDPAVLLPRAERWYRYPDGREAQLGLFTYARREGDGFSLALRDVPVTAAELGFFREPAPAPDRLHWGVRQPARDRSPGAPLADPRRVVLGLLEVGEGWTTAADRHRDWVWAASHPGLGSMRQRVAEGEFPRWLAEATGLATVGISLRPDQSPHFRAFHELLVPPGTESPLKVLHVGGWRWPIRAGEGGYGGEGCWSGHRIAAANLATLQELGDPLGLWLFSPFMEHAWPGWSLVAPSDPASPWREGAQVPQPGPEGSAWRRLCPATPEWRRFEGARVLELARDVPFDALFLHGPAQDGLTCLAEEHGHPAGTGGPLLQATRDQLAARAAEVRQLRGQPLPVATHLIHEGLLPRPAFALLHGGAGPLAMEEADPYLDLLVQRAAEPIPLWSWVYHELGPVLLDGNLKLGTRLGELFYWVAARVTLAEGGIPALDYTYSPLERFPGQAEITGYETFVPPYDVADPEPDPVEPAHARFLRELARARTELAPGWLVYGRRLVEPAPRSPYPIVELGWARYNASTGKLPTESRIVARGRHGVASVVAAAWWDPATARPALCFVNLKEQPQAITVPIKLADFPLFFAEQGQVVRRALDEPEQELGPVARGTTRELTLELPARKVVLVEVR